MLFFLGDIFVLIGVIDNVLIRRSGFNGGNFRYSCGLVREIIFYRRGFGEFFKLYLFLRLVFFKCMKYK